MIRTLAALAFLISLLSACCHKTDSKNAANLINREFKPNEDVQAPGTAKRLMTDEQYLEAVKSEHKKKEKSNNRADESSKSLTVPPACECCWIRSGNCNGPAGRFCLNENDGKKSFFCPKTQQVSTFQCIFIFGEGCFSLHDYSDTIIASPPPSKK